MPGRSLTIAIATDHLNVAPPLLGVSAAGATAGFVVPVPAAAFLLLPVAYVALAILIGGRLVVNQVLAVELEVVLVRVAAVFGALLHVPPIFPATRRLVAICTPQCVRY